MKTDIKVPAVGESITEATIADWLKKDGEAVKKNDVLLSLETDKATVEVVAESDGVLSIGAKAGSVVKIGSVVGSLDSAGVATAAATPPKAAAAGAPIAAAPPSHGKIDDLSPAARRVVSEKGLDPSSITGTGKDGRITKWDAEGSSAPASATTPSAAPVAAVSGGVRRVPMTTIRKRIAERLVHAQHTAAILTTFNEIDMTAVMDARAKYKEKFEKKYGVGLGFMGFFVKACVYALKEIPAVNAFIVDDQMEYHDFCNIGVAVGAPKGLVVPVLKNADQMSIAQVEQGIKDYGNKAKEGKITPNDMSGGTFTISNGGTYGSLMSTPILNPPQSGILGMHKIEDRAVVINKQIVVRPMMYVALSYDHRIIDGKEAVTFLVKVKEAIEDPQRILLEI